MYLGSLESTQEAKLRATLTLPGPQLVTGKPRHICSVLVVYSHQKLNILNK